VQGQCQLRKANGGKGLELNRPRAIAHVAIEARENAGLRRRMATHCEL
jgi:hypothetical protein